MEALIFIGLQASGKSSYYKAHYFNSHVRISLDLLKTRHREQQLLKTCLETQTKLVIDNTNPTQTDRQRYIPQLKAHGYHITGCYFASQLQACLARNAQRPQAEQVPEIGIKGTSGRLELPNYAEGFDELWYISMTSTGFKKDPWQDEI